MYAVMNMKRVINNEATTTTKTRQGNNNEETLKKKDNKPQNDRDYVALENDNSKIQQVLCVIPLVTNN
jgi:hypothetical protein